MLLVLVAFTVAYGFLLPEMVRDWINDPNSSHGFLVPLISGYFIWQRRGELRDTRVEPCAWGMALVLLGLAMLVGGKAGAEYFSMRLSIVPILAGVVLFTFGSRVLKILALPIAFLAFMVPLPAVLYDTVAFPLKLLVTKVSTTALSGIGIPVIREGNIIMFADITLVVADACSGMRSLISLLALSVAYAFIFDFSRISRFCIALSAVPIAVLTNILRVIITGILVEYVSPKAADGFFHEFAGMSVFVLAMILLLIEGTILRRIFK